MANIGETVAQLEDTIRQRDVLADILFYVSTIDERHSTLDDTLVMIRDKVLSLNDGVFFTAYERLMESRHTFASRYAQVLQKEYNAFIKRLAEIWTESSIRANEADIALKEYLKLDSSTGIWGPKGWRPPV